MAIDFQDWDGGEGVELSIEAHQLPTVVPAKMIDFSVFLLPGTLL